MSPILAWSLYLSAGMLTLSVGLAFARLVYGPTLPDRVVAFDLLGMLVVGVIAVYSIATEHAQLLDVAIVLAIVAFLGTVAFARYLQRSGGDE
jgi:multicomponent Na+:H+ antiporter subunit F